MYQRWNSNLPSITAMNSNYKDIPALNKKNWIRDNRPCRNVSKLHLSRVDGGLATSLSMIELVLQHSCPQE